MGNGNLLNGKNFALMYCGYCPKWIILGVLYQANIESEDSAAEGLNRNVSLGSNIDLPIRVGGDESLTRREGTARLSEAVAVFFLVNLCAYLGVRS